MECVVGNVCGLLWLLATGAISDASPLPGFLAGGDISMLTRQEQSGVVFQDSDRARDFFDLTTDAGWNCFRVRLFVRPTGKGGVIQDVPYVIALAKRIRAAHGVLLLNFHYSDTWADPAHQTKPAAWENLSFDDLVSGVERYTAEVIAAFKKEEVLPQIVQIGNEIDPGFLWPDGKLGGDDPNTAWQQFTALLKAGIRGLNRGAGPDHRVKIMIHIAAGGDFGKTKWFFTHLQQYGVAFDIIGQSYYPWWHGTLEQLRDNLARTVAAFDKDIVVVETAYPNRPMPSFETRANHKDAMRWDWSPEGQAAFLSEVIETVAATPGGHGRGVLWWYPESVPTGQPGNWYNGAMALFDAEGRSLPAMRAFGDETLRTADDKAPQNAR